MNFSWSGVVRTVVWLACLLPAVWLAWLLLKGGLGANPIEYLQHFTGNTALRLLIASLAVTPLMRVTGKGWLIVNRRTLGLAAFFWSLAHLAVYVGLDLFFDLPTFLEDLRERSYITVGMLSIVLLLPLALTSSKASIRRLGGSKWRKLHTLVYPAVIAAVIHFFWSVKRDVSMPILHIAVVVLLLLVRIWLRRDRVQKAR